MLTVQFLKEVRRLSPVIKPSVPSWAWALRGSVVHLSILSLLI